MNLNDLKLGKMAVEVDLAQEYFKKHNNIFGSIIKPQQIELGPVLSDGYNRIQYAKKEKFEIGDHVKSFREPTESILQKDVMLRELASIVKNKADLFAQIEHLIRKRPVEEVKYYDIQLIVQNLNYISYSTLPSNNFNMGPIVITDHTPLAYLGIIPLVYHYTGACVFSANAKTAAISCLFVELCHSVGMNDVYLWLEDTAPLNIDNDVGCLGVVTGQADVDSAVDAFIDSTTQYPWKLSRILVQECVYESFKNALQWKTRNNNDEVLAASTIAKSCSALYVYHDTHRDATKHFLVDYSGTNTNIGFYSIGITVEAYRTTKELLSLISENEPYMSLWTNDVNESNEIAHHEKSPPVIWLNGYGVFDGSPVSSQPYYERIVMKEYIKTSAKVNKFDELTALQDRWLKRALDERFHIVYREITNFVSVSKEAFGPLFLLNALKNWKGCDVIHVKNDSIFICKSVPTSNVVGHVSSPLNIGHIVNLMVLGAKLLVRAHNEATGNLISRLAKVGVPVLCTAQDEDRSYLTDPPLATITKVIWSNHGTIFAN